MNAPREFQSVEDPWRHLKTKAAATKARERREKIENDIQLIKNRKHNGISIPVPADRQCEYFARLESNGIWEEVFKNLKNLSDITSAFFACDMFSNGLEKIRIMMLLPQVFGVIRELDYIRYIWARRGPGRSNRHVLDLRLVSKAWKEAAEQQLLSPIGFTQPDWHLLERSHGPTYVMLMHSPFKWTFRNSADVEIALERLGSSRVPSFLLRTIDVIEKDLSDLELLNFYSKLGKLLDVHGEHIWAFGFTFTWRFNYEGLTKMVSRMPCLKELLVNCHSNGWEPFDDEQRRLIAQFPFPTISSLKRLALANVGYCSLLCSEIMEKNMSLKTVSMEDHHPICLEEILPALENHRLECLHFNAREGYSDEIGLGYIESIGQMQWPLKVLKLSSGKLSVVNGYEFLEIISQFHETLAELYLDNMDFDDDDEADDRIVTVQFPNLKIIAGF